MTNKETMNHLHGWWIIWNDLAGHWMATTGDHKEDLVNNYNSPFIVKAEDHDALCHIIQNKLKGDINNLPAFRENLK